MLLWRHISQDFTAPLIQPRVVLILAAPIPLLPNIRNWSGDKNKAEKPEDTIS